MTDCILKRLVVYMLILSRLIIGLVQVRWDEIRLRVRYNTRHGKLRSKKAS